MGNMIRGLNINDSSDIAELSRVSLGYDADIELIKSQILKLNSNPDHIIMGYELDKRIVGFVQAQIYECVYSEKGLNILGLAVLPKYQGRGIGKELMTFLEDKAVKLGCKFIRLNSAEYRKYAHLFYEKIGYKCDKLQKRFIKMF